MINQRLADKLSAIKSGNYTASDFIIADAKDGDMAFGIAAPGPLTVPSTGAEHARFKTRTDYLNAMVAMAESKLIDILLMSASSAELLTGKSLFKSSDVTPAVRFNDTTDIWSARGSDYREHNSQPFATVDLDCIGKLCSLGLYSVTFSNDLKSDLNSLQHYRQFRIDAQAAGVQHFLEVFNPAFDIGLKDADLGDYINDMILKTLAGVTRTQAPLFLKMQFNGQRVMSDLCSYDPQNLIVGILGGAAGTTRDTFELALQAEQAGARVALFGRKINLAEAPIELVRLMRCVIEQSLTPDQAVKTYHDYMTEHRIDPQRALQVDLQITDPALKS